MCLGSSPMSDQGASYRAAGVDYEALDAGKRLAIAKALSTSPLLAARGGRALDGSRGEPAFVFELGGQTLAFVVEGLGTKSMIARIVLERQGVNRFADVAYDTVAAILNDLCCVGALPLVVNAYFATGASEWYLRRESRGRAAGGLARGMRGRGLHVGRRRVALASGTARRARDRARRSGRRRGAGGMRADPRRAPGRGRRDRARGLERPARQRRLARADGRRAGCPAATPRRCPAGARSGRRCWTRRGCTSGSWQSCCARARR